MKNISAMIEPSPIPCKAEDAADQELIKKAEGACMPALVGCIQDRGTIIIIIL